MYDTGVTYLAYKYQISCYPIAIFGVCSLGGASSYLSVANDFVSSIVLISFLWKAYFFSPLLLEQLIIIFSGEAAGSLLLVASSSWFCFCFLKDTNRIWIR